VVQTRDWRALVRPAIEGLDPYVWEISSAEVAARFGVPVERVVRFDTNTSPFAPIHLGGALGEFGTTMPLNEYPDTSYGPIVSRLCRYTGLLEDRIVVGCGADEILDLTVRVFVESGKRVVVSRPSYAMYPVLVQAYGGVLIAVSDREPFRRDVAALIAAGRSADLLLLCNPNNPTGDLVGRDDIERIVREVACPVAVDEAYFEFSGVTVADLTDRYPNLVVIRTLSKAFSLAGLRVGYALASESMAELLNRVRPPNSVGSLSIALAAAALDALDVMRANVAAILAEKERFTASVGPYVEAIFPTATNFLFLRVESPERVVAALLRNGLVVRDLSARPGMRGCLRVTVRRSEENDRFVAALASVA